MADNKTSDDTKLMKHSLGEEAVAKIAQSITDIWPKFNQKNFNKDALAGLEQLELKARVMHIIKALKTHLPNDFLRITQIFSQLADNWHGYKKLENFNGFAIWPIIDFVGEYGLEYPDESLVTLEKLTPLFSAEFAIRPFINLHYAITMQKFEAWITHEDEHVRRLVSEGIRPRLPWGLQLKQFIKDPTDVINLLEKLKDDDAEYVRRSVANNLNDISKDHPQQVVDTCKAWLKTSVKAKAANQLWIAKRATRGLVKQGYPPVFGLLGFTDILDVELKNLRILQPSIKMGEYLEFEFEITSKKKQAFVLDFVIHFMKANGKQAPKVFKLKNMTMAKSENILISKKQIFKPISTRKYYEGKHKLEILLNGKSYGMVDFLLKL